MKNINKIIENEHKIVNKKDLYGLAKVRRANKKKLWKFSSAELEAFERLTKIKVPYIRAYNPFLNREDILTSDQYAKYIK